jgi:SAM-dependent methyltransferase
MFLQNNSSMMQLLIKARKYIFFRYRIICKIALYYLRYFYLLILSAKNQCIAFFFTKYKFRGKPLKLNIGCGSQKLSDHINIDKYHSSAQIKTPANVLPFQSNSVDVLYTSHMVEHLAPSVFNAALIEWHRVLKQDGKVMIRCPNFELYVKEWLEGDDEYREGWGIINVLGFSERGSGYLNRNGFTVRQINRLLNRKGFRTIRTEVTQTRPEYDTTPEFRENGDILYEGLKETRIKVLYVDALRQKDAITNTKGIRKAYENNPEMMVEAFDYRDICYKDGVFLMNQQLFDVAKGLQPDFIHLGKCESVKGKTIQAIKKAIDCKVIHFYGDIRDKPSQHVIDIGKHADSTLLYHKDPKIIEQYRNLGLRNIGFWWVGTDPEVYCPVDAEKEYDVVFFSNNADFLPGHEERRRLIKAIADNDIKIHLFGNNWDIFRDHPNVFLHGFVVEKEFVKACSKAKITLGYNAVNDVYFYASWRRPFNCMACGTLHVTRFFPGLEEVFENKEHLVWFHNTEEAIKLIKYYLHHTQERERIAEKGRLQVVTYHTWDHRISEMISIYKKLGGTTNDSSL